MVSLADKGGNVIVQRPEGVSLKMWYTNGSDVYPGRIVTATGQTTPDVEKFSAKTDCPYGIAIERVDGTAQDPDTAIADNTAITVAPCGSGMVVWVQAVTSRGAILPGDWIQANVKGQIKGTVIGKATITGADATTTLQGVFFRNIGRAADYDADVAALDYVQVRLCH